MGTEEAINRLINGVSPVLAGGISENTNGNGSLMRILPMAFYLFNEEDITKRTKKIYEVSSITHGHLRSKIGCHIYVEIAIELIKGATLEEAYKTVCKNLKYYYNQEKEIRYYNRLLDGNIKNYKEDEIQSSGYIVDTLEAVMWCLLNTTGYKEAMLKCVNLGNDTDTIAAIAGGLAGIYYGVPNIPSEWLTYLKNKELIHDIIDKFHF